MGIVLETKDRALHCQLTALEAPLLVSRENHVLDLGGSGEMEDKMVLCQTLNYYSMSSLLVSSQACVPFST